MKHNTPLMSYFIESTADVCSVLDHLNRSEQRNEWPNRHPFWYWNRKKGILLRRRLQLLTRLVSTFGIRDLALSFFRSYLQDRTQVVTVNGIKSSPSLLTCGVPQGSVLGPILFILYAQPLSDIISYHSVSHHVCGWHWTVQIGFSFRSFTLSRTIEACISDVKVWIVQNKLQLNDDKTEILLIGSAPGINLPSSVRVGLSDISFFSAARNLGVIFDSELALKEQVNKLCQLAYLEIRRIGSIR